MIELMPDHWEWNANTDLIYSPDDNAWYFQRYPSHETSQLFPSRTAAAMAQQDNTVEWRS